MTRCGPIRLCPPRRHPPGAPSLASVLLAAVALGLAPGVAAQEPPTAIEYQVKAAFLYNFAKFVDWPPETFAREGAPFVIGVLSNEPFSEVLEQVVRGKTVNGRSFDVRRLRDPAGAAACQMVFVGARETRLLAALLKAVRRTAVLTVGDGEAFTRQGGMMNFVVRDNRVRFEVNTDAAARSGLSISSKLLQLATIVRDVRPAEDTR